MSQLEVSKAPIQEPAAPGPAFVSHAGMADERAARRALALMALSALLFAAMSLFARLATREGASWAQTGAVRATVGALVAAGVAHARGGSLRAFDKKAIMWRSLFGTASMLLTFNALSSQSLPLGDTVTLLNLTPVFLAVLAPRVLREPTRPSAALAIGLSLVGVVFILRPAFVFGGPAGVAAHGARGSALGAGLVATGASFCASIAMMMLRRAGKTESPEAIAFHFSVFAAAVHTVIALAAPRLPALHELAHMVAAGLCAGFAQIAMTRAYTLASAARVSGMSYLSVVASAVAGVLLLGERPTTTAFAGMALAVGGGLLLTFGPRPGRTGPPAQTAAKDAAAR